MQTKILSLDGGGSWAILQAMALKATYQGTTVGTTCRAILNQFDVVSANSGGSLMLAGMIEKADQDIDAVIEMFQNDTLRHQIFSKLKPWENILSKITGPLGLGPKYKAKRKIEGLRLALPTIKDIPMYELREATGIKPHLVICAFDYDLRRAVFFKTQQDPEKQYEYTLTHAINAASNAPVNFFDEPVRFNYGGSLHQYWDGAIGGNNNPVLIGITELLRIHTDVARTCEDIQVLSIGTGNNLLPVQGFAGGAGRPPERKELMRSVEKSSLGNDIKRMCTSIISEPPDAANFMAHMLLGGVEKEDAVPCIIRMNALIQPFLTEDSWTFPPALISRKEQDDFVFLIDLEMDAVERDELDRIITLGHWWTADKVVNQSIRYDGKTFRNEIGHPTFSTARTAWLRRSELI